MTDSLLSSVIDRHLVSFPANMTPPSCFVGAWERRMIFIKFDGVAFFVKFIPHQFCTLPELARLLLAPEGRFRRAQRAGILKPDLLITAGKGIMPVFRRDRLVEIALIMGLDSQSQIINPTSQPANQQPKKPIQ